MKERILNEIRRLAEENGGKAPGMSQFEKMTGINPSDWSGKLWARWGDALTEAGYEPNKLQEGYDTDYVLDRYEELCRHFGRAPTKSDVRLYAHEKQGFLSYNTFTKHFGSTAGVRAALRERAVARGEDDLLAILPDNTTPTSNPEAGSQTSVAEGWVYLLQSGNHYKIGRSDELEKRVKQISIAMPEKVELVHAIRTDDSIGIEAYWHRRFADRRANGEWFKLLPADVKAFKRRKFQ